MNMKKTVRNTLLATSLCLTFGAVLGICLNDRTTAFATGAETPIISPIAGASVRYPGKNAETAKYENDGLRFSSTIDKAQYDALVEGGYTVTTGTFILPLSYWSANPVNEENCFSAAPKYYWATAEGYSVAETEGKLQILNVIGDPSIEGDVYRLNGSVLNLKDNSVLNVKFIGVGYIKYEKDETTTYAFAETTESNARSVADVAQKAYYNQGGIDDETRTSIGEAYVQRYLDLYNAKNGAYPTVEYTETVKVETKNGFKTVEVFEKSTTVSKYDDKIPATQIPAMLDGSAKVSKGYIMNSDKPADAVEVTEDNLLSLGVYNSETAAVTKSSEWSVDGKSESLCIDYSKLSSQYWAGVGEAATPFEWGGGKYILSFVAYSDKDYVTKNSALWYKTNGQEVSYDITLKAGVPQRISIPVSGSALKLFTFENPQDSTCKLYIDDVYVYSGLFTHEGGILVDPKEELTTLNADDWSFEGKKSFYASNWYDTNVRPGYGWQYSGLNDENKADTVAMIIYIEEDFKSPDAMWMSVFTDYNETQSKSYYLPVDLHKGANYVEFKLADDFVKVSSIQWQKHAMWVDNIQVFNSAKVNRNGRVYAETYVDNNKVTVVAGFTDVITKFSKEVELTISYQTAEDGEWVTLATEAKDCALSHTIDLTSLTYCKVKVTATSQGATLATQVIDLVTSAE